MLPITLNSFRIDRKGRLHPESGTGQGPDPEQEQVHMPTTIPDWSAWQIGAFRNWLNNAPKQSVLFGAGGALIKCGRKLNPLQKYGRGSLQLYHDRIEIAVNSGRPLVLPLLEIEGEGVFKRNLLEFYYKSVLYQVRFHTRSESAWKWQLAIQQLRAILRPTEPPIHQPQRATNVSAG